MKSRILYRNNLPSSSHFPAETLLFYDSVLARNKFFKAWLKGFKFSVALKSGEELKTLSSLTSVLKKISQLGVPQSTKLTFVAVGGGSVGDFVGFLSSVYLRGRDLVMISSTWLSAIDSAHGGKNGLNFEKTKNQIGTFYLPVEVFICRELLFSQPPERLTESMGEIIKIAILSDKKLFSELAKNKLDSAKLYKKLSRIINLKYQIVEKDPLEKKGYRRLLNLGHTMGHVFESVFSYPHGIAVMLGIQFAARWSLHLGLLNQSDFFKISMLIDSLELKENLNSTLDKIEMKQVSRLLLKDKKLTSTEKLDFIFIRKIGQCERQSVSIEQILNEVQRQKRAY